MTLLYVSIDGDDIGRLLTQRIYQAAEDEDVRQFSELVTNTFNEMAAWVTARNGVVLFCSGDSIFFNMDNSHYEQFAAAFVPEAFNLSIGLGTNRKEAHWALNIAKSLGKNRTVHFDQVREDIFGISIDK